MEITADTFKPITDEHDPRVVTFLVAWHENGRACFEQNYPRLDYDLSQVKSAHNHRKYIYFDDGSSGCLVVEKATGRVYGIKGYGKIHRGKPCGPIDELTAQYEANVKS